MKKIVVCVLIIVVAVTNACDLKVNIDCSSINYKYATCPVNGALTWSTASVVDRYSKSGCSEGHSYGFRNNAVWVDRGCRAKFNVCSCRKYRVVDCDSWKYKYKECTVPGASQVTFVKLQHQRSKTSCLGKYGIHGSSIYVNDGCRGAFHVCYN